MALSSKLENELSKFSLHSSGNRVTVVLRSISSYGYFVHAMSGAVGVTVAITVLHPLDTARARLRVDDQREAHAGSADINHTRGWPDWSLQMMGAGCHDTLLFKCCLLLLVEVPQSWWCCAAQQNNLTRLKTPCWVSCQVVSMVSRQVLRGSPTLVYGYKVLDSAQRTAGTDLCCMPASTIAV